MNAKKHLLIGLVFGLPIGWALRFLQLPDLERNDSFLLGFVVALAVVSLAILLFAKRKVAGDRHTARPNSVIWSMLLVGSLAGGLTLYRQHVSNRLSQNRDNMLQQMAALLESRQKNDLAPVMHTLLEDLGEELKNNPRRTLQDTTIARIVALSAAFQPHRYIEADTLSKQAYSPERGQLLLALVLLHLDSSSFGRIKRRAVFAGADLQGAVMQGADLSGIGLREANLKDADLRGANLRGAQLTEANLWGANLNQADLSNAELRRADLRWVQGNNAALAFANLNGALLANAQLRQAELHGATFQWAQSSGALFNGADLSKVDFVGANFSQANLSQANLRETDLRKINLSEANLEGVQFDKALVEESWPEKIKAWQPIGWQEMQEKYAVVNDSFAKSDHRPLFHLIRNADH